MAWKYQYPVFDKIVRVLSVLAIVLVGFGHLFPQNPAATGQSAFDLFDRAEYALPDGSLPYICLAYRSAEPDSPRQDGVGQDCPACRIVSAILLPVPAAGLKVREPYARVVFPKAKEPVHADEPVFRNTPARAPPVLIG